MSVERMRNLPGGIAVLCGGPGGEREVSLASGETAHRALLDAGVENRLVIVPADDPDGFLAGLECGVAIMMLHGEFGEDGRAQEILEKRGIPFTGSDSAACRLSMDKNAVKKLMVAAGVPTPRWAVAASATEAVASVGSAGLEYPLFVKPNFGGSSVGVSRVGAADELSAAVSATLATGPLALIEEMVIGRELTVGWLDGAVLPAIELEADGVFYDYHAKYKSEKTRYLCPAVLEADVAAAIAGHARTLVGLVGARDLARIDIMLGAAGPMVLELNALPGFTSHSLFPLAAGRAGIPVGELCLSLAAMAAGRGDGR